MTDTPLVALALQGGGAHGAFAWGVLDRLLEEDLRPHAISGVSSGAILGTLLVQGWVQGGPEGARREMRLMWDCITEAHHCLAWPSLASLWGWDIGRAAMWWGLDIAMRVFGPTQINPLGHAPLRTMLEGLLDRDRLAHPSAPRLTVAATDIESGEPVLFSNEQIDIDVLLASCCLPLVFAPVTIRGRAYWDGGCAGNPPLAPLMSPRLPDKLVLIRAQPRCRPGVPSTPTEISNRLHEIACQAVLSAELAGLPPHLPVTVFDADPALHNLPVGSKLNGDRRFVAQLFNAGRKAADRPIASKPTRAA